LPAFATAQPQEDIMLHKRIGSLVVTLFAIVGCAHPRVDTANGEISTPAAPANARSLPTGSTMDLTLDQQLGTQTSHVGDNFSASVANAIIAQNGRTAIPAGAKVWGHVTAVTPSGNATQQAALVLDFDSLTFNGRSHPFAANVTTTNLQTQGPSTSQTLKNAAIGAAAGAALGAVLSGADRDKILIGAGLGAVAGTAISLGTQGENGVLPVGSRLRVQTTQTVALR
jgi:YmgG-like glycine-zipper protein